MFRLLAEMGYEFLFVEGVYGAAGHDQRRMEDAMLDRFQHIDIDSGCSIDEVIHCCEDGFLGVSGFGHGVSFDEPKRRR